MIPDAYYKNIFEIDYKKLKKLGYKNIFLDVDNTLVPYTKDDVDNKTIEFVNNLKKDFNVLIISNSMSNRVLRIADQLKVKGYYNCVKPLKKTYKKILNEYNRDEIIFVGDQFMTDILGSKRMNLKVILVDRLLNKEPLPTKFWRFFEKILLKKYEKNNEFKKYRYYDNVN